MKKLSPLQIWHHIRRLRKLARYRNKRARKRKRRSKRQQSSQRGVEAFANQTLQYLGKQGFTSSPRFKPNSNHRYVIKIPRIFSLIENPDETLETLEAIAQAGRDLHARDVFIDHSGCDEIDLGASTVMDIIVMGARKKWLLRNHMKLHGQYSTQQSVNEILKVSGIIKHIRHSDSEVPPE